MKSALNYSRLVLAGVLFPVFSYAQDAAATTGGSSWAALAVGLGIAIAVLGAATAQGRIASNFMEGVARNPGAVDGMRTPLILSLIFVETLVLFTVLIVIMLMGKM